MYLFIDEQYRIYKAPILSGKNRLLVKQGKLSAVHLSTMQGMNIDGSFSDIQEMPEDFESEESTDGA